MDDGVNAPDDVSDALAEALGVRRGRDSEFVDDCVMLRVIEELCDCDGETLEVCVTEGVSLGEWVDVCDWLPVSVAVPLAVLGWLAVADSLGVWLEECVDVSDWLGDGVCEGV